MRNNFLPFSKPSISEAEIAAVGDVLRSGWITTGPKSAEFEKRFGEYVGCPGTVALTSATAGMHCLLKALDIGPGDEVITPSMTWVSTVNIIVLAGAKPVFADIDRNTLMTSADHIRPLLNERTKLVIPVHFAGAAVDLDPIRDLLKDKDVRLIEDAAHAIGTRYKGAHVGKTGTSLFSFHPIKNMTTGEGGMFCSDDERLLERIRRLKFHGLGVDAYDRQTHGRSAQAEVQEPGFKYNFGDIAAVIGLGQLARVNAFNRRRKELADLYRSLLSGIEEVAPLSEPAWPMEHSWHLFIVRVMDKAGISRDDFMKALKDRNIGTGLHFRAAHLHRYYRETLGFKHGDLPNTEWNSDRICSLPLFPDMTEADVRDVTEAIKAVIVSRHS